MVVLALAALATPAHALSCPDTTGGSSATPIDVTYFLSATQCTKTDPGASTLLSARVFENNQDNTNTITFSPAVNVATSFTAGEGCVNDAGTTADNVASYKWGFSTTCTVTVRLVNGAELSFVSQNDTTGFASSLTSVRFSVPATTTAVTSSSNPSTAGQSIFLTTTVTGGVGAPTGGVDFKVDGNPFFGGTLGAAGSDLSVVSIASGVESGHACAITTAGGLKCWGANGDGQLGDGTITPSTLPVDVLGLSSVVAVGLGNDHSCALTMEGGVKCWGKNGFGQLGNGTTTNSSTPADVTGLTSGATAIAVGKYHTCAMTTSGGVKCWGINLSGQVGDNSQTERSTPVDVNGLTSGVGAIASGGDHTCAIIAATGAAKCWGNNASGGIGDNSTTNRLVPTDVSGLTSGVAMVSVGNNHTCAVTTNGAAMCWGANENGQLGIGSQNGSHIPVSVNTLESNVVEISAGVVNTCVRTATGAAKCWGDNSFGQLGDGSVVSPRTAPVDVAALGTSVKNIVSAYGTTYAVTTGLGAKSWGLNDNGRLGDGTTTARSLPGDVSGLAAGRGTTSLLTSFSAGVRSITVEYLGEADRTGSTSPVLVQTVNKRATSTVVSAAPASPSTFGQSVTLTATVTSAGGTPGGSVTFSDSLGVTLGTATLSAGVATLSTSALSVGARTITATYSGDSNFLTSAGTLAYTVNKAATTTTVVASPVSPGTFGQSVTLTATVNSGGGTPGGSVIFTDTVNGTLGTATLNGSGVATLSTSALSVGANTITATYSGNASFLTSAGTRAYTVNKAATTTTVAASPASPSTFGQSVTLTATVTSGGGTPGGTVTFTDSVNGTLGSGTLTAGVATLSTSTLSAGAHTITAIYSGNTSFLTSSGTRAYTVNKAANAITFPALANVAFDAPPPVPTATAQSGLAVTYASTTMPVCTVTSDGVITLVTVGACSITASQAGNANFVAATPVAQSFTATSAPTTTTVASLLNPSAFGQSVSFRARVRSTTGTGKPTGTVTITDMTTGAVLGTPALTAVTQTRLSAGTLHACSVGSDGGVSCWGSNAFGQLGDGTTTNRLTPVPVSGLSSGVAAVAAGFRHSCALTTAGAVLCWGQNRTGALGDGTTIDRLTPVAVTGLSSGVKAIAAATEHSCALTVAGAVLCWGANQDGRLGDGTTIDRLTPVPVSGLSSGVAAVAAGGAHSCALTTAGAVRCWGFNVAGQLGDGTTLNRLTPTPVVGLSAGVAAISTALNAHSCAVTTAGAVRCWGFNDAGQLGDGTTTDRLVPTQVVGLSSGVASVAAGGRHSCAVTTTGATRCWGGNNAGQTGDGTSGNIRLAPVQVSGLSSGVAAIAAGSEDGWTCALTTAGAVRCWGANTKGQLGDGSTTQRLTPVATLHPGSSLATVATSSLAVGTHVIRASYAGNAQFMASASPPLLRQDVTKGANTITFPALANIAFGATPPGPAATASSGLAVTYVSTTTPVCTATPAGVITVAAVGTCSITASQAGNSNFLAATPVARSFSVMPGANVITFPALANIVFGATPPVPAATASSGLAVIYASATTPVCTATQAGVITILKVGTCSIAAFQGGNANVVAATSVTRSFSVTPAATATTVASSLNPSAFGQPVTFTARVRSTTGSAAPTGPVTITDTTTGAVLGTPALAAVTQRRITTGSAHVCTVGSDGGVSCWGFNDGGQLGDGTTTNRSTPLQVTGLSGGVAAVVAGNRHSCALTTAGAVLCWGLNSAGQLGDGTTTNRSTPVQVTGLSSGVAAIFAGGLNSCALTTAGAVLCWGSNINGEVGDGTTIGRLTPVPVSGLSSGVAAIDMGGFHSCALTTAGAMRCWGDNSESQIGDGTSTDRLTPTPVVGLSSGVAAVSASRQSSCALTTAGAVLCWGINDSGQVGDGTLTRRPTPVAVTGLSSAMAAVSAGGNHSCALTTAGAVRCWGLNDTGQVGDGTTTNRLTPVQVSGLTSNVAAVSAGAAMSCALTTAGAVRCWGLNFNAQLGDGTTTNRPTPVAPLLPGASLATVTTSGLTAGAHAILANYAGNANFTASVSPLLTQTVGKAANAITFPALANTVFGNVPPAPAATASSSLAVTYASTTTPVCTATPTGVITLASAGTCSITASQAGNANFVAAAPVARSFSIAKASTTTALATSAASTTFGASVTLTATVAVVAPASATPSGVVTFFRAGSVAIGTASVSAGKAILSTTALPAGANSITARYDVAGADPRLTTSISAAVSVSVAKRTTATTLSASRNPVSLGGAVTLTATVGAGATGNVVFRNGATTIATVALANGAAATSFTPTATGTLPLTAAYAGDANFNASTSAALKLLAFSSCTDGFASALPVNAANASVFGSTVGATGETGEPNHAGNSGALNSVWCTWTAPATGAVTFDTTGSNFDTTLGVYTGASVGTLTQVAANDNVGPGNPRSRVAFAATAGTAYRVAIDGVSATGSYVLNIALAPAAPPVTFASVLPTARSIATGATATAFATIINTGAVPATACSLAAPPGFPATFSYQITNTTNTPTGTPDTPVNIATGAAQGFVFAVTPLVDLNSSELAIVFDCTNTPTTTTVPGLNTLLLSASSTPSPDLISIGSTLSGDGIANIPGATGATAFGAATVNIGAAGTITATVDDNGRGLALTARLCVTNPTTGACTNPATPATSATFPLAANASATVAVFVTGTGNVPFDPGGNRLFLRFKTADGVTRGATSVAVRTQ